MNTHDTFVNVESIGDHAKVSIEVVQVHRIKVEFWVEWQKNQNPALDYALVMLKVRNVLDAFTLDMDSIKEVTFVRNETIEAEMALKTKLKKEQA